MPEIIVTCPKGMCEFCRKEHVDLRMRELYRSDVLEYYSGTCPETGGILEMYRFTEQEKKRRGWI